MTHGSPDYWGRSLIDIIQQTISQLSIDIAAQSVSELINRPKYGGAHASVYNDTILGNDNDNLCSVSGTGIIYGGFCKASGASSLKNDYVQIRIDNATLSTLEFTTLNDWFQNNPVNGLINLNIYNDVDYLYVVTFGGGITFETSLLLTYFADSGFNAAVRSYLWYATI